MALLHLISANNIQLQEHPVLRQMMPVHELAIIVNLRHLSDSELILIGQKGNVYKATITAVFPSVLKVWYRFSDHHKVCDCEWFRAFDGQDGSGGVTVNSEYLGNSYKVTPPSLCQTQSTGTPATIFFLPSTVIYRPLEPVIATTSKFSPSPNHLWDEFIPSRRTFRFAFSKAFTSLRPIRLTATEYRYGIIAYARIPAYPSGTNWAIGMDELVGRYPRSENCTLQPNDLKYDVRYGAIRKPKYVRPVMARRCHTQFDSRPATVSFQLSTVPSRPHVPLTSNMNNAPRLAPAASTLCLFQTAAPVGCCYGRKAYPTQDRSEIRYACRSGIKSRSDWSKVWTQQPIMAQYWPNAGCQCPIQNASEFPES
ncbi:hypothetical protein CLF_101976 [Clonorchis sinensis]|uniref:Uncharacterized protein n=1 Tax=Clonorchis sinensis TaxID=79923 RepID=G7Y705_CLOSI|nr:hypothetical protein CLF_101976 [Clonorchis sinensis]